MAQHLALVESTIQVPVTDFLARSAGDAAGLDAVVTATAEWFLAFGFAFHFFLAKSEFLHLFATTLFADAVLA